MKLNQKQKNAIENLISLAEYIKDQSIYSKETEKIINKSIEAAEKIIGINKDREPDNQDPKDNDYLAEQVKKRFNKP